MRTLRIIEHISLDGVIQHSADDGDFPFSDWTVPYRTPAGREAITAAYGGDFDLLLGRRTYDLWSDYWPRAPRGPLADSLNAATKHVAKMASTISKPDGLLVVAAAHTQAFLAARPVRALWGVGPKSAEALESRGIRTVADILDTPRPVLERILGAAMGDRVWHLSRGLDAREVSTSRIEKSIGHEETFHEDIADPRILRAELLRLSDRAAARLRENGWEARTVALKVRFADFSTFTRSQTLPEPTDVGQRIGAAARDLLDTLEMRMAVRLIGVRAENLVPAGTAGPALWDDDEEWRRIEGALDGAAARFGSGAITRASLLKPGRAIGALPSNPVVPRSPDR